MESAHKQAANAPVHGNGSTVGTVPPTAGETAEDSVRAANPNLRRALLFVTVIGVLALLAWGVKYFLFASTHQSTDDARIDASTISVTSKISERVDRILVDTDAYVHKGQLLIALDDRDERSRVDQAQAALTAQRAQAAAAASNVALTQQTVSAQGAQGIGGIDVAQASIAGAQAQVGESQAALAAAQEGVPAALANSSRANADLHRTQSLVSTGDLPKSQLETARASAAAAQSQYQQALANVAAARDRVSAASSSVGAAQGQLSSAQGKLQEATSPARVLASQAQANAAYANVSSLQAQLQLAKDQLRDTKIVAPADGYVGEKSVEAGQVVGAGASLLTIIPSRNIFITANYKETQIGSMRPGQPVDIRVDAYKGAVFAGRVLAINPASQNTYSLVPAQNASGNFIKVTQRIPVKIGFEDPPANLPLRPGMSVETSVKVK